MWSSRIPGVVTPNEKLLSGIAITEELTKQGIKSKYYKYLFEEDLPNDPKSRFAQLYHAKTSYKINELEPYCKAFYGGVGQPKSLVELVLIFSKVVDDSYYAK